MNNAKDYLKSKLEDYLSSMGINTTKPKFNCLICGSSDGANFVPNSNRTKWKCFSGNHKGKTTGDIFEYVQQLEGIDFKTAFTRLKAMYNISDDYNTHSGTIANNKQTSNADETPMQEKNFIENEIKLCVGACEHTIGFSDYLTKRGISPEVQRRFNIGYFGEWLHPKTKWKYFGKIKREWLTPRIIIPTSECSYLARITTPEPPKKLPNGKPNPEYKYFVKAYKVGNVHIFNSEALINNEGYCYIFEGEIDCLSAIQLGFNAVGLGSTSMIDKLFQEYKINPNNVLIIALDNDDGGKKATQKLITLCRVNKIPYYVANTNMLFNNAKDCNEALINNKNALKTSLEQCKKEALKIDKQAYLKELEQEQTQSNQQNNNIVAHHNGNGNNSTSSAIPDWYNLLRISQKGNIISSLHNIKIILQNDSTYKGKIEYNELTNMRTFNRADWEDVHESMIKLYLEEQYNLCVSIENINHVCNIIEYNNRYHPIREHLNRLKWDGIPRVNTVFSDFLGAKNNIYTQKVASITFIGAVARIFQPGIKYDTCTVFVGRQGLGKSKFISKLAINQDWFTDGVTTFDGKEFYESIQGKWLIELGEGTAFQKSIKERSKQAIASQQDSYRKPYARNPITLKRQCIFLGTTNNYDFLKDETGDRRYYPIDVDRRNATKNIDTELTPEYVNQLWAEALERYKQGEEIYITDGNILAIAEQEQRNHFDESPLQSDIYNFLDILLPPPQEWYSMTLDQRKRYIQAVQSGEDTSKSLGRTGVYRRDRVSVKEIMCELYGYELNQPIERKISLDISRSLTALGWHKTGKALRVQPYGCQKMYSKD
ncbi:VapE domain-containing protein [uncultured Clostridium sp.]|uniref:VapE domain-containing protein n=1 Tax=uncultured Clostridium sp. TaxID=59620 RepID=UPI0025E4B6A9|nr:VapE domain-containing protein [uncultured Clostridium sp.]